MKITKDTKMGDIMPEGMEPTGIVVNFPGGMLNIPLKKKEEKNFEWYVKEYFKTSPCFYLRDDYKESQKLNILNSQYPLVDFSTKIGLLKFICDDINAPIETVLHSLPIHLHCVGKICPKEFLESIF